jgi:hypothetical protein
MTVAAGSPTVLYLQGSGTVGLVKDVMVTDPAGTSTTGPVLAANSPDSGAVVALGWTPRSSGVPSTTYEWQGFLTLEVGDSLTIECDVDVYVWVAGALLPLP